MRLGVLFSGGKDSVFASHRAAVHGEVVCLITLRSANPESYMFHTPAIDLTALQAESMGIPLIVQSTAGEKEAELEDMKQAIERARDEHGIEGVVTGAIASVYQATRVQRICRELDIWCINPLWQIDQLDYMHLLLAEGFEVMVTGVFAYPLTEEWLGRTIGTAEVTELATLAERYKINPSGEGGELETLVTDCPLFPKRIRIYKTSVEYADHSGTLHIEEARLVDR